MGEVLFGLLLFLGMGGYFAWRTEWRERGLLSWLKAFLTVYFQPGRLCEMYYLTDEQLGVLEHRVEAAFPE